ncbi:MAG TPA: hypothetical protein VMC85_06195 [Desulfomonilaceae bacterium]|nr:hypothetical protein [Desulfomonilaceae bacterium]
MKSFDVARLAAAQGGEYVLGARDLHSQACYLIYGSLQPGEGGRLVRPGEGYEEILCAVSGSLMMDTSRGEVTLKEGHALHIGPSETIYIANQNNQPVVYVIAGGRSGSHQD